LRSNGHQSLEDVRSVALERNGDLTIIER
jgi:uncharacterized membrane protein YcaP (DUF421 family)